MFEDDDLVGTAAVDHLVRDVLPQLRRALGIGEDATERGRMVRTLTGRAAAPAGERGPRPPGDQDGVPIRAARVVRVVVGPDIDAPGAGRLDQLDRGMARAPVRRALRLDVARD